MSIPVQYPPTFDSRPTRNDDARVATPDASVETPDQPNAFAQWPRNKRDTEARPGRTNARLERESLRRLMPPGRRPPVLEQQHPLIAAYRAGVADAKYLNDRLEDDDALMVRLATASGLYAGTPTAADLTAGERKQLVTDLVRAFTQGIDWNVALGPDPDKPDAIYYDGLTLRNASGKSLTHVNQDLEARIDKMLHMRGIDGIAGRGACAGLARQVRRMMTVDPTLSLQPPPDAAYGTPRWVALWTGMHTLADQGLSPDKRDVEDLVAAGRAATITQTWLKAAESPKPATPGFDMGGLLLMAHAAGKLDLRAIAKGEATISTEQLTAYYKEAFADELRMLDSLADLARSKPPTGAQLARRNLRAAGIDPDYQIKVDSLLVPTPYGPVRIAIPVPFTLYTQSISDFYVSREKLDLKVVQPTPQDSASAQQTGLQTGPMTPQHGMASQPADQVTAQHSAVIQQTEPAVTQNDATAQLAGAVTQQKGAAVQAAGSATQQEDSAARSAARSATRSATHSAGSATRQDGATAQPAGPAAQADVPDPVAQARAKLAQSLRDEFNAAFDAYKTSVAEHVATIVDASISRYGKNRGIDLSNASISVSWARQRTNLGGVGLLMPGAHIKLATRDSNGYFISIETPAGKHAYFLSFKGEEVPLPADARPEAWSEDHEQEVFGDYNTVENADRKLVNGLMEITMPSTDRAYELASGKQAELADRIKAAVPSTLEKQRANAYGVTVTDLVHELELSLIPFRATYLAIREGDVDDITTSVQLDALMFIPALGEGLALGMRVAEAMAAGLERTLSSIAKEGLLQAIKLGASEVALFAPGLGRQVGKVLLTAAQNAIINPMDMLAALRGAGRLGLKGVRTLIEHLKALRPGLAKELIKATGESKAYEIVNGHWTLDAVPDDNTIALGRTIGKAGNGPMYRTATAEDGSRVLLQRYDDNTYTAYNPQTRTPQGPLFVVNAQGKLVSTVRVEVLKRYRVTDAAVMQALHTAARSDDGTIMWGAKRYAEIHGDYLELVPDHATTTSDRPIWRIAGSGQPGTKSNPWRLYWDEDLGEWRPTEGPGVKGGGNRSKYHYARLHQEGDLPITITDGQLDQFYDALISDIRGGATGEQVLAVKSTLKRIEADPRGKALLRAMCAHHELLGQAPSIILHEAPVPAWTVASTSSAANRPEWFMNLNEAADESADRLVKSCALAYDKMTGLVSGKEHSFSKMLRDGGPSLDPALEAAWTQWFKESASVIYPEFAASVISDLRQQLREARCFGGTNMKVLKELINDAIAGRPLTPAANTVGRQVHDATVGLHIVIKADPVPLRSIPPLPEDVVKLQISGHSIRDASNLPRGIKWLDLSYNKLAELPGDLPSGLLVLNVSDNRITSVSEHVFPGSLVYLRLSGNQLSTLPSDITSLTSATIHLKGNPITPESLPVIAPGQSGPQFFFD